MKKAFIIIIVIALIFIRIPVQKILDKIGVAKCMENLYHLPNQI